MAESVSTSNFATLARTGVTPAGQFCFEAVECNAIYVKTGKEVMDMIINGLFLLVWLLNSGCAALGADEINVAARQSGERDLGPAKSKVDPRVLEILRTKDVAWVVVVLNAPYKQGDLTKDEEQLQRKFVAEVQEQVLRELLGTPYTLRHRADLLPTITMDVGAAALAILEESNSVLRVQEVNRLIIRNPIEFTSPPRKQD